VITITDRSGIAELTAVLDRLNDLTPVNAAIAELVASDVRARIKTHKTAPDGTPWEPWAPMTFNLRHAAGTAHHGLLYDSGALFHSIQETVDGSFGFDVGTDVWYAPNLQDGKYNQPARPFLGWTLAERAVVDVAYGRYIELGIL